MELATSFGVHVFMDQQFRKILPLASCVGNLPLLIWDLHNQKVIASMGMNWDTGAPLWPYQTAEVLLYTLNFPAFVVAYPTINIFELSDPAKHVLILVVILAWWRFLGTRMDTGIRSSPPHILIPLLAVSAGLLILGAVVSVIDAFRWWFLFGTALWSVSTLLMMRFLAPGVWCVFLASLIAIAIRRRLWVAHPSQ